jgi:sphinganine-1-phosphate aldolase
MDSFSKPLKNSNNKNNRAKATKGIEFPEAIVPVSAHAAFAKGCSYFDVKLVTVPLDKNCR